MQHEEEQGKEEDIQKELEDNPEEVAVLQTQNVSKKRVHAPKQMKIEAFLSQEAQVVAQGAQ
jgi:hypothetical protein